MNILITSVAGFIDFSRAKKHLESQSNKIQHIHLRFFTLHGEWGRPDMLLFKLFNSYFKKKPFYLNNYGNYLRYFTYIKNVVQIVQKLIDIKLYKHKIYAVCSNKPVNIKKIISLFKKNHKVKVKNFKRYQVDILNTHGDNAKTKKAIKYSKFITFNHTLIKTFTWYKSNKIFNY